MSIIEEMNFVAAANRRGGGSLVFLTNLFEPWTSWTQTIDFAEKHESREEAQEMLDYTLNPKKYGHAVFLNREIDEASVRVLRLDTTRKFSEA